MKNIACTILAMLLCAGLSVSASADSPPAAETAPPPQATPASGAPGALERCIFITVPETFVDLDRAPVRFFHEKHTKALEPESCETCHPVSDNGTLEFAFPKQPDVRSAEAWMNSHHDACIKCHSERAAGGKETGPVTCGECHADLPDYHTTEYLPVMPSYYDPLRDSHHGECLNCHREPAKLAKDAGELDWKKFYVKVSENYKSVWPKVGFDYQLHDKHDKALKQQCKECHYLSPQQQAKIAAEAREPKCKDWLRELDPAGSLIDQKYAHARCINCHLARKARNEEKAGPITCSECHTDSVRPADAMKDVPRPECEQEEKILIQFDNETRMPGAAFNHKAHQERTRACQDCHHETMRACKECHTPAGTEEGDFITLAEAYHLETSAWSCIGCHAQETQRPDCAGCHHLLPKGLSVTTACSTCHSGSLESLNQTRKAPAPETLIPEGIEKEWEIKLLEKEYKPSKFKHLEIVQKLTERINTSALASYFHTQDTTLCAGCHHYSPLAPKKQVPQCSACHTTRTEPDHQRPDLMGAYHQQCLGCHQKMGGTEETMPQTCEGCHARAHE